MTDTATQQTAPATVAAGGKLTLTDDWDTAVEVEASKSGPSGHLFVEANGPARLSYSQVHDLHAALGGWLAMHGPEQTPEDDGDAASYTWPPIGHQDVEPLADWERELMHGPGPQDTVLDEAKAACYGDRQGDYGHPREDFTRTAIMWQGLLLHKLADGESMTPEDVARCLIAVKLSRDVHAPKRDNRVDGAGYFLCLDRLETGQ